MLYVTDTHALVWYILDTLPEAVDKVFMLASKTAMNAACSTGPQFTSMSSFSSSRCCGTP